MRIAYDISVLGYGHARPLHRAGIYRFVENIAYGLAASKECDLVFHASRSLLQESLDYLEANPGLAAVPLPHSRGGRAVYKKLRHLDAGLGRLSSRTRRVSELGLSGKLVGAFTGPNGASLHGVDLFHSPFHPLSEAVTRDPHMEHFLTVHDLIPLLFPQFCGPRLQALCYRIIHSLGPRSWVIANSQATKDDVCEYRRIDPSRVFITHLAADPAVFSPCADTARTQAARARYGIPDAPYLLSLSTLEPRKNLDHVIRCFAQVAQQERVPDLRLVLVGSKGWYYDRIFEEITALKALRERIIVTGHVPDADLAPVYSGALAFVYMSLYEGFGLPVLEAMQCGVPVITSNTSSLPEVVGDAGVMLDPRDVDGLCAHLLALYKDPSLRARMARRSVDRAKRFNWERCTAETIAAYRAALSVGKPPARAEGVACL